MTKHIVCFDTETTGLDVQRDWIIQLSLVKFDAETFEEIEAHDWYIKPSGPYTIDPAAEAVHHISAEKLESEGVSLAKVYLQLVKCIKGCDLLSYNGNGFDIRILYYNLLREHLPLDLTGKTLYDAYTIEVARTSRRLGDVYRRYYGYDFEDAHNSLADVRATIAVFKAQQETKAVLKAQKRKRVVDEKICRPEFGFVSFDGFLTLKDGLPVFAQGKYRGKTVWQVQSLEPSYLDWVMKNCAQPTREYIEQHRVAHEKKTPEPPKEAQLSLF